MKAEIRSFKDHHYWIIKSRNGIMVALGPCFYTRRDNAIRGLSNFVEKMWTTKGIEKIMDSI